MTSSRFVIFLLLASVFGKGNSLNLVAYFSQSGLHGEIHFSSTLDNTVLIETNLEATLQYPDQAWSWGVHSNPVDYTTIDAKERCDLNAVGSEFLSFDDDLGFLILPGNESTSWEKSFNMTGLNGLWGKSLVLYNPESDFRICSTITTRSSSSIEYIAEAKFRAGVAGSIYFRWLKDAEQSDLLIYSNLFHTRDENRNSQIFSQHSWKIYVTDIFESMAERIEENCNVLQVVYDPQNFGAGKGIGDIDLRVGKLNISENVRKENIRQLFRDEQLVLLPADLTGPSRKLYVVIYDAIHPTNFLACAKIRHLAPRVVKSNLDGEGLRGELSIFQRSRFEPTWLNFAIKSAANSLRTNLEYAKNIASFTVSELPPAPSHSAEKDYCSTSESVFDPTKLHGKRLPPPGFGTQEQYKVGDLSGKLKGRNKRDQHDFLLSDGSNELNGIYWDLFLPLSGPTSIVNRGFIANKVNRTNPLNISESIWTCGVLSLFESNQVYQMPIQTAEVLFRYPIVGKILFRQPKEDPTLDTTIIVEYLIHADGANVNNSAEHRWAINVEPPGKDFYDWQNRCISVGDVFNPHKISFDIKEPEKTCSMSNNNLCRLGDLANRLGTLAIAGGVADAKISRKIFTDSNLPLSGFGSILGKSVTIFDDHGPVARGERLACSLIGGYARRKVVAKDWYPNGGPAIDLGKMEMIQQSEYELTNADITLKGLSENSGYHVHLTPVEFHLEFPCEASTLYGHWNPRNVDPKHSPLPGVGSTDLYEMGDLSGKFGTLDGLKQYQTFYNDSRLPLFGYESIIGRSIVIHKKDKMLRWACSTLERGYAPNEAREVRAIVSYHHPYGFAYGYIRLTQLIGIDGSKSDTVIEVKLRHPGVNDRNSSMKHNWQIWVNPIGVDATVKTTATRCVAGGYVWNPFYTQLADPLNDELYRRECGPKNPLRCYVGDVSARLGTIDIGVGRFVFSDPNFPLEGDSSAMGRSIVIFGPNHSGERFACANIEPDHDIVKYINLERPPRFVTAQFLEDIRAVMGLPEWFLAIDTRTTKILHNGACIQMLIHFKGPKAHQLELDFSRLLASGKLDDPSLYIPGYVNQKRKKRINYKTCSINDPNDKKKKKKSSFVTSDARNQKIPKTIIFVSFLLLIKFPFLY